MCKARADAQRCHPFAEKRTAQSPSLTRMRKAKAESQVLLTIRAGGSPTAFQSLKISHASHASHWQSASCEAPRFAIGFSCSFQSAKPLYGRKNAPALNRRDGDLPPARKLADGRDLPPCPRKWGCALRVVKRRPLFNDSVVKDQVGFLRICLQISKREAHSQCERSL